MSNPEVEVKVPGPDDGTIKRLYMELLGREAKDPDLEWARQQAGEAGLRAEMEKSVEYRAVPNLERIIRAQYPEYAYLLANPELRDILMAAVHPDTEVDDETFVSQIRNTNWWKNTSAAQRQYDSQAALDPAETARRIAQKREQINRQGIKIGAIFTKEISDELALRAVRNGLSDEEITDAIFAYVPTDMRAGGDVFGTRQQLKQLVKDNMIQVNPDELNRWAIDVTRGQMSMDSVVQGVQYRAKLRFQGNEQVMAALDAGVPASQLFNEHRRLIAQELEMDEDAVDLMSPQWDQVLSRADAGKVRPATLSETREMVRSRPEWERTANGRDQITQMGQGIAKMMGVRG